MTAPAIAARNMSAGYGAIDVVNDIDLEVAPGEVVALMGANGAGKSTTLMALCGLLRPSSGAVEFGGESVTAPLFLRARAGLRYVSEERSIVRGLSTRDNLRLGLGPTAEALRLFPELEPLLDRPAGLLSGGEQQILTLARALAGDIKVLLADELSLGLAPLIVQRLLRACREAASNQGVGVLIVEQHPHLALQFADRACVLNRGQIVLEGNSSELASRIDEIEAQYLHGAVADGAESASAVAESAGAVAPSDPASDGSRGPESA